MIAVAIIFFLSVLIVPSLGLSSKHKGHKVEKHRSYSQWERSRHSQQRFSH